MNEHDKKELLETVESREHVMILATNSSDNEPDLSEQGSSILRFYGDEEIMIKEASRIIGILTGGKNEGLENREDFIEELKTGRQYFAILPGEDNVTVAGEFDKTTLVNAFSTMLLQDDLREIFTIAYAKFLEIKFNNNKE